MNPSVKIVEETEQVSVTPRTLGIDFPDTIPKYWFNESPFLTHMLNTYTLLVPDNESYYIRQLSRCLNEVEDKRLKRELVSFLRQEGQHGIGHKAFWKNLENQGMRYEGFVKAVNWFSYQLLEPILPRSMHLSNIACIEHINAYLGNFFLSRGQLENAEDRMKLLFCWHFAEEIEHKAIAFDVFQAVGGKYPVRVIGALLVFPLFYLINTVGTFYLLAQYRKLLVWSTWRDFGRYLFIDGALLHALRNFGRYLMPGFHPWHTQDYALAKIFFEQTASKKNIHPVITPGKTN